MSKAVLIIEDEQDMANYLRDVMEDEGWIAATSNTGGDGLNKAEDFNPDLVLLDLKLPDIHGVAVCEKLKQLIPEIVVIMITGQDTPAEEIRGLKHGADDYITKPIDPDVLKARIRARFRTTEQKILQVHDLTLNPQSHQVKRGNTVIKLTPQEYRLLEYFMENPNQVLSREMILSRIWQGHHDIQSRVVDVYVGYLRKKIDFKKPKLLHSVRGFGYVMRVEEDAQ